MRAGAEGEAEAVRAKFVLKRCTPSHSNVCEPAFNVTSKEYFVLASNVIWDPPIRGDTSPLLPYCVMSLESDSWMKWSHFPFALTFLAPRYALFCRQNTAADSSK